MYDTNVMILTGAGASIPCGIPGMAGMADEFKNHPEVREYAETYELLRGLGASADVEELLELANAILSFADENKPVRKLVEKCVAPRGGEKPLRKFTNHLETHATAIDGFRDRMFDWITDICLQFKRPPSEAIYSGIVEASARNDIPVFTTNYDPVLDHVARELEIDVVDNFVENAQGKEFWDETLSSFHGSGLKLVKIHGSIQWHATPQGTIQKTEGKMVRNEHGEPLTRLLIFPTRFKDIYRRNYFPLYSAFTRTLGMAQILIVIGHSLRDEYLKSAIRERLGRGDFALIFVGPEFPAYEDLAAGVRGQQERRIVHLNRKIQDVHPLIYQTLDEIPVFEMRSHVRQAREDLSRGRKDKFELVGLPQYVEKGEKVDFSISWDSVVGGGAIRAMIEPEKNRAEASPFEIESLDGGADALFVNGRKECTRQFSVTVPSDDVDKYGVRFILDDVHGKTVTEVERVFTVTN